MFTKDLVKRMTRQATEWEKIFAHHISNTDLVSRMDEELSKFNSKKTQQCNQKMGERYEQIFHQKQYTYDKQAHEKMFNIINHQRTAN